MFKKTEIKKSNPRKNKKYQRRKVYEWIRTHGSIKTGDKAARDFCGFPKKPRKRRNNMHQKLKLMWQEGRIEGIAISKNKWEYFLK